MSKFGNFLFSQSWMKVISALWQVPNGLSFHELVDLTGLSVGGTQGVIRRLVKANIISSERIGNRVLYSLQLSSREEQLIGILVNQERQRLLQKRQQFISLSALDSVNWIDDTALVIRRAKAKRYDTT